MKYNHKILIAAALEMASHLTPFPCVAGICLVPFLFRLWLIKVLFIGFGALFPPPVHFHTTLLGGHRARPPASCHCA